MYMFHAYFCLKVKFNTDLDFEMSSNVMAASQDIMISNIHGLDTGDSCDNFTNPLHA